MTFYTKSYWHCELIEFVVENEEKETKASKEEDSLMRIIKNLSPGTKKDAETITKKSVTFPQFKDQIPNDSRSDGTHCWLFIQFDARNIAARYANSFLLRLTKHVLYVIYTAVMSMKFSSILLSYLFTYQIARQENVSKMNCILVNLVVILFHQQLLKRFPNCSK